MKPENRRTYISSVSQNSCLELFQKGMKPRAVLEHLRTNPGQGRPANRLLTIGQVTRQYNKFNREKKGAGNKPNTPSMEKTLQDLVGTGRETSTSKNQIPVDTRGDKFLAGEMSKKQLTDTDQLVTLRDELTEKAELLAELSSIYSKAAMALDTASMIDGWEQGNTGSGTVWKQVEDFLKFLKDDQLAKIS